MGFSRAVYERVGGFREMFSEDIDMSTAHPAGRILIMLSLGMWHKRRVDFRKFFRQVYVFGMSRITLKLLYPDSMKAVHVLPALFVVGCIALYCWAYSYRRGGWYPWESTLPAYSSGRCLPRNR